MNTEIDNMNVEIDERLDLIQHAALKLNGSLNSEAIDEIATYIEALCRHRDLPMATVAVPTALKTDD